MLSEYFYKHIFVLSISIIYESWRMSAVLACERTLILYLKFCAWIAFNRKLVTKLKIVTKLAADKILR